MPAAWTIRDVLAADERALEDWGIDRTSVQVTFRSLAADSLSFALNRGSSLVDPPFVFGRAIQLKKDGTCVFAGVVRELPAAGNASQQGQRYIVGNKWDDFEAWIYEQTIHVQNSDFTGLDTEDTTHVVLCQDSSGTKITTDAQIAALLTFASASGSASFTGVTPPFEEAKDQTIAACIRRMAAWTPDLGSYVDYSAGTSGFEFVRRGSMGLVTVDLTAGDQLASWEINRLDRLLPKGIVLKYQTQEVNPGDGKTYYRYATDESGTTTGPYVIRATIPIAGGETAPTGLAAAYLAAIDFIQYSGSLVLKAFDPPDSIHPAMRLRFSHGQTAWATADAVVTEVSWNLGTGESTIVFGPSEAIGLDNFAALNRRAKATQDAPSSGLVATKIEDTGEAIAPVAPPVAGGGGGGGGGGGVTPPFALVQVDSAHVIVTSATVHGITPTGIATNIDVGGTNGTWTIYLDCTLDSDGNVTAAAISSGTSGLPANTPSHAYVSIGTVVVSGGAITTVTPLLMFSQDFVACGRNPADTTTTPGTYFFFVS